MQICPLVAPWMHGDILENSVCPECAATFFFLARLPFDAPRLEAAAPRLGL